MIRLFTVCAVALSLAGCAGLNRVDNTVESFARWEAAPTGGTTGGGIPEGPQRYRFERLPSQADGSGGQAQLEGLTRTVLQARDWSVADTDADARWTVQVSATTVRSRRDAWNDPWGPWQLRGHFVAGNGHVFFAPLFAFPPDPPDQQRQVALLIRDAANGRVAYETRAEHVSRWNSTSALWQAMLEAALRDFPRPPAGPRQVLVDLPPN
jgi:hypothetical protein